MLSKARIKLNGKKIYAADGHAVKEMLKITEVLYAAQKANSAIHVTEEEVGIYLPCMYRILSMPCTHCAQRAAEGGSAPTAKLADIKATKKLASEITESGAKLYDLLDKEKELRKARMNALQVGG